jgi:hypothetical protein
MKRIVILLMLVLGAMQPGFAATRQCVWTDENPKMLERYEMQFIAEVIEAYRKRTARTVNFFAGAEAASDAMIRRLVATSNSNIVFCAWPAGYGAVYLQTATVTSGGALKTSLQKVASTERLPNAVKRQLARN